MFKLVVKKEYILFFITLIIGIVELFFVFSIIKNISSINKKIAIIKKDLNLVKKEWPLKEGYLEKNKILKEEIDNLSKKFIEIGEESKLLSFISLESKKFNIEIVSIRPTELQSYSSTQKEKFMYLPIFIKVKGGFHNFAKFLDSIQKSKYFFETKELTINSKPPYHEIELVLCGLIKG